MLLSLSLWLSLRQRQRQLVDKVLRGGVSTQTAAGPPATETQSTASLVEAAPLDGTVPFTLLAPFIWTRKGMWDVANA